MLLSDIVWLLVSYGCDYVVPGYRGNAGCSGCCSTSQLEAIFLIMVTYRYYYRVLLWIESNTAVKGPDRVLLWLVSNTAIEGTEAP